MRWVYFCIGGFDLNEMERKELFFLLVIMFIEVLLQHAGCCAVVDMPLHMPQVKGQSSFAVGPICGCVHSPLPPASAHVPPDLC